MSTLTDVLQDLLVQGAELSIEGGKLRVRAADSVFPPEKLAILREHKEEILRLLPDYRFEAPLSAGQEGLWFIQKSAPDSAAYNLAFVLRIESERDHVPALRRALQRLVNRHALLRTTFAAVDGSPRQIVSAYRAVDLREIDAAGQSWQETLGAAEAVVNQPFQPETEGAYRSVLFRRGPCESLLLLCLHHIAVDGWSLWMMADELLQLYEADGRPNPLPPVQRTFSQLVTFQRDQLAARGEELRRAWMDELEGASFTLSLPTDRARPPRQSFRGAIVQRALEPARIADLRALARRQGTTLSTVFLTAFQVLLHRYTGQEDFCVGFGSAGRDNEEFSGTFGYMVNMLVLRARVGADAPPSFASLLEQTHERVLGALERQDYPFPRLVKDLLTGRDPSRAPLTQVGFVYQGKQALRDATHELLKGKPVEVGGARFSVVPLPEMLSELDLTLEVTEHAEGVELAFRYNSDLFDAGTIERMAGHLATLFAGIVDDPDRPISQLPLLTAAEREQVVVEWNQTGAPFSSNACIHQLFEEWADRTPDAVALVDFCDRAAEGRGVPITYGELDRRANQVAHRLRGLGVGPEMLVGLCLERGADLIVGLLGILKAGGAFVMLDPEHPSRRLAFLLEDTGVPVLLTRGSLLSTLPETRARVVDLDQGIEGEPVDRPQSGVGPSHLAYVLYTSGSTGDPNGVLVEHRGLVNSIEAAIRIMETGPGTSLSHVLSFNFDGALFNLFCMICAGGAVYLAPRDGDFLGKGFIELMEREAITHTLVPPTMLAALPDAALPSLRTLVVAGERCPAELVARWGRGRRFINMYGPTEASILATYAVCVPGDNAPPIGRPIANLQAFVMDRRGQLAPAGLPGELCLGGVGVARGYLNRPALTAQKLIENPFGEGRLYRTGDMVRYRDVQGGRPVLEFLGRLDNQVKIRGYRIELSEIENALRASLRVRDAAVTIHESAADGGALKRLVAFVTPALPDEQAGGELSASLRRELQEALPPHLIPSAIIVLPALPLTLNGKVDLRALPPPEASQDMLSVQAEPRNDEERKLAEVWCRVLGLTRIGIHDNFFELGGDSLLAVRVMSHLPSIFRLELPLRALLETPTIHGLAKHIETARVARQIAIDSPEPGAGYADTGSL